MLHNIRDFNIPLLGIPTDWMSIERRIPVARHPLTRDGYQPY